nr:MmpS family transport accessory protein [Mycobacterium spongiae]
MDLDDFESSSADSDGEWVWPADRRWRPLAATIGGVVAVGAIATAVIINSGDSASTKATVGAPAPRTATSASPRTTAAPTSSPKTTPRTSPTPSRTSPLSPETVTTLTPPSASPSPSLGPGIGAIPTPTAAVPPTPAPPGAALNPRAVVYRVTGAKQLLDLVNVVYTDEQGFPKTEFNVSLPWTKMVVLNPGVQTQSVVATSIYSRLNCSIVNAAGQPVVASASNSIITTCTR